MIRVFRLTNRLNNRLHVIPHGHYLNCYENQVTQHEARVSLGYEEDAALFLFGAIRPYKGILDLIEAFRRIENPKAELLIVGNPINDLTKKEVLNRCQSDRRIRTCLQYVPQNEIQIFMNAADVAVFPFTDILTSGSVLLAMSFGKAIIAPGIGCIPETLDALGGNLYDPNDEDALAKGLKSILSNDLVAMGRHNRVKVETFSWDKIARMTSAVYYRSLVAE